MRAIFLITVTSLLLSCNKTDNQYINFVNPFIGTGAHGHTFPGATNPFGMVQLSPDTRIEGWDGCSGYHYTDSIIYGFSHTHLSGTGIGDYCDLLLMPLNGKVCFDNGYKTDSLYNYTSTFKKDNEFSKPGFYQVLLDKYGIKCDLTTTKRVGVHQYEFSDTVNPAIILDLEHRDQLLDWEVSKTVDNEILGKRISRSWADEQHFYFCMQLSSDFEIIYNKTNEPTKAFIKLKSLDKSKVIVKVGVSTVSQENARENLIKEASSWDFNGYVNSAQKKWDKELSKIEVQSKNKKQKEIFYTSLYHTMIAPNLISDINGQYRGTDLKINNSDEPVYTVFSLWDTFRSAHPLYNALTKNFPTPNGYGRITLNYEKFLLDANGKPVRRYPRKFSAYDMEKDIQALLAGESVPEETEAFKKSWREAKREAVKSEYAFKYNLNYYTAPDSMYKYEPLRDRA